MESSKWKPTEEEREVMESVWMQVKGACEKLKEEINAQNEHIKKIKGAASKKKKNIVSFSKCKNRPCSSLVLS